MAEATPIATAEALPPTVAPATPAAALTPAAEVDSDRNAVFTSLVREDGDITGLVAYSIYKQNKLDWLLAFEKARGRPPNEAEQVAYIIGESTPRRLATYRQLADATLAGENGEAGSTSGRTPYAVLSKRSPTPAAHGWFARSLIGYVILAAAILAGAWLIVHYGQPRL